MDFSRQTATRGATHHTEDAYTPLQRQEPSLGSCHQVLSGFPATDPAVAVPAIHNNTLRARVAAEFRGIAISSSPSDRMELLLRKRLSRACSKKTSQAKHPTPVQHSQPAITLFDLWIENSSARPRSLRRHKHSCQDHP